MSGRGGNTKVLAHSPIFQRPNTLVDIRTSLSMITFCAATSPFKVLSSSLSMTLGNLSGANKVALFRLPCARPGPRHHCQEQTGLCVSSRS